MILTAQQRKHLRTLAARPEGYGPMASPTARRLRAWGLIRYACGGETEATRQAAEWLKRSLLARGDAYELTPEGERVCWLLGPGPMFPR